MGQDCGRQTSDTFKVCDQETQREVKLNHFISTGRDESFIFKRIYVCPQLKNRKSRRLETFNQTKSLLKNHLFVCGRPASISSSSVHSPMDPHYSPCLFVPIATLPTEQQLEAVSQWCREKSASLCNEIFLFFSAF